MSVIETTRATADDHSFLLQNNHAKHCMETKLTDCENPICCRALTSGHNVITLALSLWPRQGIARLQAKRETQESHHMLSIVQSVWGNEPSHSQVNSHVGSSSAKSTFEFLKRDCRGENPLICRVFYIIKKLLKRRCLKCACIAHLDIWNTSYDQKKGWESNWH
jgi:hypothetical protein